jgi:hypothetical protein
VPTLYVPKPGSSIVPGIIFISDYNRSHANRRNLFLLLRRVISQMR